MKKSNKIAISGMITALSVTVMFLTGLFPFATFALPALAGLLLIAVVVELGYKTAFVAFVAVGFLSMFLAPDKEAAILFIAFFGYYPILKGLIEKLNKKLIEYIIKFSVFNISVILAYLLVLFVFPMPELVNEFKEYSSIFIAILLVLGNITFLIYDIASTRVITMYIKYIRPKFLRRF